MTVGLDRGCFSSATPLCQPVASVTEISRRLKGVCANFDARHKLALERCDKQVNWYETQSKGQPPLPVLSDRTPCDVRLNVRYAVEATGRGDHPGELRVENVAVRARWGVAAMTTSEASKLRISRALNG